MPAKQAKSRAMVWPVYRIYPLQRLVASATIRDIYFMIVSRSVMQYLVSFLVLQSSL